MTLCLLIGLHSPKTAFFIAPFRAWEFPAGVLVASLEQRGRSVQSSVLMRLLALAVLMAAVFALPIEPGAAGLAFGHPAAASVIVCLATASFLLPGLPVSVCDSLPGKALARVGDYSYSLYLYCFPVIVFINMRRSARRSSDL